MKEPKSVNRYEDKGQDGICFRDMTCIAPQADRGQEPNPIKRIKVGQCLDRITDVEMQVVAMINSAWCLGRRKGGSEPRSDPRLVPRTGIDLAVTSLRRRRSQERTTLKAR